MLGSVVGANAAWDSQQPSTDQIDLMLTQINMVQENVNGFTIVIMHADIMTSDVRKMLAKHGFQGVITGVWVKVGAQRNGNKQWNQCTEFYTIAHKQHKSGSVVWNESHDPRLRSNVIFIPPVISL